MKYIALLLALAAIRPAFAQQVQPVEDGNWNYVSLMGNSGDARYEAAKQALQTSDLQNRAHIAILPAEGKMFQGRYASTITVLPCLRVEAPNGDVLYQQSGNKMPTTAKAIASEIGPHCPLHPKQPDTPTPPVQQPVLQPVPDTPDSPLDDDALKVYVLAGIVGACVGGYEWYKDRFLKGTK